MTMQIHDEARSSIAEGQLMMADGTASTLNVEPTIRQLVAEQPSRARILEQYDLPYCCCGGNPTLSQACAQRGVNVQDVLRDFENLESRPHLNHCDLYRKPIKVERLQDLFQHFADDHRSYLREELPRLSELIGKVIKRHGELYPELWELQELCDAIEAAIERHIAIEERLVVLAAAAARPRPASLVSPGRGPEIAGLEYGFGQQKQYLENQLVRMHSLTAACTPPESACNTYRVLLESASEIDNNAHDYLREIESVFRLIARHDENPSFGGCGMAAASAK